MKFKIAFAILFPFLLAACSGSDHKNTIQSEGAQALRPLSKEERKADFEQLLKLFQTYYGPYQYKESLLRMNIEQAWKELSLKAENANTDEEYAGYVMQFAALLRDGHVSVQVENTSSGTVRYRIPIVVTPIGDKALIADIAKDLSEISGLKIGDEILSIDGKTPAELSNLALKYRRTGSEFSERHWMVYAFYRPSSMVDLTPKAALAEVRALKADGASATVPMAWTVEKYNPSWNNLMSPEARLDLSVPFAKDFNSVVESHRFQMGQVDPIFLTAKVQETFKFVKVYPSTEMRKKYGLEEKETPAIYAALYRHQGKNVLLVRIATFYPMDFSPRLYMKAYMALLDEYQDMADVLVLDQTHNPGGSYCAEFYNIFARDNDVQGVSHVRADRKWVNDLKINWPAELLQENPEANKSEIEAIIGFGLLVEKAYDQGSFLSEPFALFTGSVRSSRLAFNWTKPMLVLIDSLAGSCGDIFPMLVKANQRAKLFGEPTMGLGGNVEEVGILANSRLHINMTRGLFMPYKENGSYLQTDYIENHGVAPDYPYSFTVEDFRGGLTGYVKAFSDKAVEQIP